MYDTYGAGHVSLKSYDVQNSDMESFEFDSALREAWKKAYVKNVVKNMITWYRVNTDSSSLIPISSYYCIVIDIINYDEFIYYFTS